LLSSDSYLINYVFIPILIFLVRIIDVSIGTIKLMLLTRGYKIPTFFLGFIEILLWIIVVSSIINNLNHFIYYIAYALGFATGSTVGLIIEEKLAIGIRVLRIIKPMDDCDIVKLLRNSGYGATLVVGEGMNGPVHIIYSIIKRKNLSQAIKLLNECNPKLFFTVEEARQTYSGYFQTSTAHRYFRQSKLK
jgi:uncharacterized protein YebE (UPF0316 family)